MAVLPWRMEIKKGRKPISFGFIDDEDHNDDDDNESR